MTKRQQALVVGAAGGIGGEVARQLRDAGWAVRGLVRRLEQPVQERDGIAWVRGDAMRPEDVAKAAEGCEVIVHAVNPPGYRRWGELVLPMLEATIAAAQAQGATIVLPGTVYNYGQDAFPAIREDSPQRPQTRKGAIRVEMEARLRAYAAGGGRALIVRAGDFFGPRAGNNWFSQGLIQPGKAIRRIQNPAAAGVGHQWAYLPDVARNIVDLLARRESLEPFASFHLGGHWDEDGTQMAQAIQRVLRRHGGDAKLAAFPWWLIRLIAPFNATLREMLEMRYLWRQPVRMDNGKLLGVLGRERLTPLDEAVEATLKGLGCLPE
ncbi:NAD-dependent epimerase/dehydratase family protein [Chromobacterium sp. IIBBL 290-4]|uniref:NAD-dependent epimerase/dehydratase family protein n=1 Tax=Chromobacterium sp. IIBBL 290-4 TaxID=2953890 RepID=UPI0020B7667C|nr:NAD-dependent epimerase/dehydratase family protein [Chromobacterium sp. IIBBL 290-4]UTH72912.1 NAD(P)H-binding protein [Chromobacterium sp. IIBBL 290-4]